MTLQRLPYERTDDGVVTLWLEQPERPVVVLDSDLLTAIDHTLDAIGPEPKGLVLASRSRVFIAGANLAEIMELDDPALDDYLRFGSHVFARLATLPCTTVAAINGAALGGGLEIALHCDHLVAARPVSSDPAKPARPYLIGLPEAGLSICPGWGGTCLLPARMDPQQAIEMTALGKPMSITDAADAGLVEPLLPPDDLLPRALVLASAPKASARREPISVAERERREAAREALERVETRLPESQGARAVAACVRAGVTAGWDACLEAERANLIRLRNTEEGRSAIEAFFARSGRG